MTIIPHLIDYVLPSEAAICMHEAGHATAALMCGIAPAFVELSDDPNLPGPARSRITAKSQIQVKRIACGAFAVEYLLFRESRLVNDKGEPIEERRFVQIALGSNAHLDKVRFFGANHEQANGKWPEANDRAFMNFAIARSPQLSMALITEIAEALLVERRLDCPRLLEIGGKHLPGMAAIWTCADNGQDDA